MARVPFQAWEQFCLLNGNRFTSLLINQLNNFLWKWQQAHFTANDQSNLFFKPVANSLYWAVFCAVGSCRYAEPRGNLIGRPSSQYSCPDQPQTCPQGGPGEGGEGGRRGGGEEGRGGGGEGGGGEGGGGRRGGEEGRGGGGEGGEEGRRGGGRRGGGRRGEGEGGGEEGGGGEGGEGGGGRRGG